MNNIFHNVSHDKIMSNMFISRDSEAKIFSPCVCLFVSVFVCLFLTMSIGTI